MDLLKNIRMGRGERMRLREVSSVIVNKWREKLEELDNEEGAEYLDFDICESIMITELKKEAIKQYHRSDGNKHKFIKEFFKLTDDDVNVLTDETGSKNGK